MLYFIFARSGCLKISYRYLPVLKLFFYFHYYPKHNNMIKNYSQTMGLLHVISAWSGKYIRPRQRPQSHGIGKRQEYLLQVQQQVSITSCGSGLPGLVRQCPETPVRSHTERSCEKVGKGRKGSSWSSIIEHSATRSKNVL